MCGIAGIYRFDPSAQVDPALLDRMTDALSHRGPDGRGVHIEGPLGLGHRRLSIIDLSADAAQPLCNENGTVWVTFNGEIYNYRELRAELISKGHTFRSQSDTEVLVHLYEEAGQRMLERLRGMFAFALWDRRQRRLLLARDRFGQKPLYYRLTPQGLHFGSEIKAILEDPEVAREPDLEAIDAFLTYGYVPTPKTAFSGIHKLPAAHHLTIEQNGRHAIARYWRLPLTPKQEVAPTAAGLTQVEERVLELLDESTKLRMISDVPLGAFLSGGIDSSAVVASMAATADASGAPVRTFCIGFAESGFDESTHAETVARHLGTDHQTLRLDPGAFDELQRVAWHYGEPFADASCLPTFALSRLARQHVTVALTGDGGDELFGGYRRYVATQREEWLRGAFAPLKAAARNRLILAILRRGGRKALANELEHNRQRQGLSAPDLYITRLEAASPELKSALYSRSLHDVTAASDPRALVRQAISSSHGTTLAERCTDADGTTYLPDDILVKVDVASMAHGLECRAPLLDHLLAEYVAGLPFKLKIAGSRRKAILKGAVGRRLPAEIVARRKKGFSIPLKNWFQGRTDELLRETLLSTRARQRGYFEAPAVEALLDEHGRGLANHQAPLFSLLMLELWHTLWIDTPQATTVQTTTTRGASTP